MLGYIIKDMAEVFRFLPYGMVAGIIVAILISAINDRRLKRQGKAVPVASVTCFYMYVVIVIFITFLSREPGSRNGIDLELFSTWGINARNNAYVVENILLFIPFGFVCAWALKSARRFWSCALYGLLFSGIIECMQLVTHRGFFQVDDILTNLMGTVIGYVFFRCVLHEGNDDARRARIVYVILAIAIVAGMALGIMAFSGNSPQSSNELSRNVAGFLVNKVDKWLSLELVAGDKEIIIRFVSPLLRRLTHASEYAALAVIVAFGLQVMKRSRARMANFFYAVLACGGFALVDQALQIFNHKSRAGMGAVVIDIIGAAAGGCIYVFLSNLFEFLAGEE